MKSYLTSLIYPYSILKFFGHYKENQPFVVNNPQIKEITQLPFLESLDSLLNSWSQSIQAHLPDLRDESSSIDTNAKDAQKLFDNGMGLLFNDVQNNSPLLQRWLDELRRDLGLSALTYGRCLIYATPQGKGTAPHFDQNINFVLQIHGTKNWTCGPNKHVQNPMGRHTMGQNIEPELLSYSENQINSMPTTMPEDSVTFKLMPGSLLFVPRGCWHSTKADSDALSLNFTFTAPTWIDLFSAALRGRLIQSPQWRETADGVSDQDPEKRTLAENKFKYLLSTLVDEFPTWMAADILSATESE